LPQLFEYRTWKGFYWPRSITYFIPGANKKGALPRQGSDHILEKILLKGFFRDVQGRRILQLKGGMTGENIGQDIPAEKFNRSHFALIKNPVG
jgi:hypothetical protein